MSGTSKSFRTVWLELLRPKQKGNSPWEIQRARFSFKGTVLLGTTEPIEWSGVLPDFKLRWKSGGEILSASEEWRDSVKALGGEFRLRVNSERLQEYLPIILSLPFICRRGGDPD